MTEKLFYIDAYIKEFTATVLQIKAEDGRVGIVLDRTAFYPEGGGQLPDTGLIKRSDGSFLEVTDTQEEAGTIWHYVSAEDAGSIPLPGEEVSCVIDWNKRFDHMQQHSGEHIVSGMICSRFNCDNVGFHMGEETVEIDYNARISFEEALEIEAAANEYIWQDHKFNEIWPKPEELKTIQYRSKKELEGDVRITSFPGADTCACCGTHVSGSAQVGLVKFISAKNFHDGTRLELLCGKRAMDYLSMNYAENKAVAVHLSTSEANTADHVEKLIAENIRLKAENAALEEKFFEKWADSLKDRENVLIIEDWMSPVSARKLADLAADKCSSMVAVFAKTDSGYSYSVIKRDSDITGFIKEMNAALNGRGGGRNGFAQGSVQAKRSEIENYWSECFKEQE